MTLVRFISADGRETVDVDAVEGSCLLALAQANGQPLEGTCEGSMACSTCHVIVDAGDYEKLPRPSEPEEDMLDFAAGVTRTSRLACQIRLTDAIDTLTVRIPGHAQNMQGR